MSYIIYSTENNEKCYFTNLAISWCYDREIAYEFKTYNEAYNVWYKKLSCDNTCIIEESEKLNILPFYPSIEDYIKHHKLLYSNYRGYMEKYKTKPELMMRGCGSHGSYNGYIRVNMTKYSEPYSMNGEVYGHISVYDSDDDLYQKIITTLEEGVETLNMLTELIPFSTLDLLEFGFTF